MNLFGIVGQQEIRGKLLSVIQRNRIANAYLFFGAEGVGKEAVALEFAAMLNCTGQGEKPCGNCPSCKRTRKLEHPDLKLVYPLPRRGQKSDDHPLKGFSESEIEAIQEAIQQKARNPYSRIQIEKAGSILINSIREVRRDIFLTAAESGYKIIIIFQAELMTIQAVNALLKVLEEPPDRSVFILVTSKINKILPTIRSRCQPLYFPFVKEKEIADFVRSGFGLDEEKSALIARLSGGSVAEAIALTEDKLEDRSDFLIQFSKGIIEENDQILKTLIDNLESIRKNDFTEFKSRLKMLMFWIRDLERRRRGASADSLSYPTLIETTDIFLNKFPKMDALLAVRTIEKCIDNIERNVYIRLALLAMIFELNRLIKHGSGADGM